uniref:Peptidase M13 C-terminal domain-containing protein n=1 Tax=Glossina brevipalpis TaxID=37001 RepID=A0A1A9WUI8_9MUSC
MSLRLCLLEICFLLCILIKVKFGVTGQETSDNLVIPTVTTEATDGVVNAAGRTVFDLPTIIDADELLHETGLYMLDIMNLTVDPCENFYEYACGNWRYSSRVPAESRNDSLLRAISKKIKQNMIEFLKNTTAEELSQTTAEAKAKLFFQSCLSPQELSVAVTSLMATEDEAFEQLQLDGNETDAWMYVNFLSPYEIHPLLPVFVNYSHVHREFEISIIPPVPFMQNYKNYTSFISLMQENQENLDVMLEFEANLTSKVNALKKTEHLTLSEYLQKHEKDAVNWAKLIEIGFNGKARDNWIINNKIANFTSLERFLRKSKIETLRNYVKWRTFFHFYDIWGLALDNDANREKICLFHTETYFSYALVPWFSEIFFDTERREDTLKLADALRTHFKEIVDSIRWLDRKTKSEALAKLDSMDLSVGYSDEMRHREVLDQVYGHLNISNDWYDNLMQLEINRARLRKSSVHKFVLPPLLSPYSVNAYYADFINSVFVTIGIAQMPLYHISFPSSLKFGGTGLMIGHEICHGFDTNSYRYNYDGKVEQWWSFQAQLSYRQFCQCLENQYNKFIYRGVKTNATHTMPDNIADNVGARLAYIAYSRCAGTIEGKKKPIKVMNFTNDELFFIKLAQTFCIGRDDAYKMEHIVTDSHAYGEFRVLGILHNMPEFSQTFKCKLGSEMNPFKKCMLV